MGQDQMPIVTLFNQAFSNGKKVAQEILRRTGYQLITDDEILNHACERFKMPKRQIEKVFFSNIFTFNQFTHEQERSIACLRLATAERVQEDRLLVFGLSGFLIPKRIGHMLRICLLSEFNSRIETARKRNAPPKEEIAKYIQQTDEDQAAWIRMVLPVDNPWDPTIFDECFSSDKTPSEEIADRVAECIQHEKYQSNPLSSQYTKDFLTAARVETTLLQEGHIAGIDVTSGIVTLTLNKHIVMLGRLEEELKAIAGNVSGVGEVKIEVAAGNGGEENSRPRESTRASKILLVDDEAAFAQALSDRLKMRDLESIIAYDGEAALTRMQAEEETDVMILDLRMPGIDGIEVLRRVKREQPEIEVIILTGRGSETDRKTCMQIGAFAYLKKPVDIQELSQSIRAAREKIRRRRFDTNKS